MIERPQGFEHENSDCSIRAVSLVLNIPYEKVHEAFKKAGRKDHRGIYIKNIMYKVYNLLNVEAKLIKRSGTAYKLSLEHPTGKILCSKRGHMFAIIDGVLHNETKSSSIIRGAWILKSKEAKE
jgi:hypothetical protein